MPLPGSVLKVLLDGGAGIEMQPLKTAHASSVAFDVGADVVSHDECGIWLVVAKGAL
jgi:hypothetical protein